MQLNKLLYINFIFIFLIGILFIFFYFENISMINEKHFKIYSENIKTKMCEGIKNNKKGDTLKEFIKNSFAKIDNNIKYDIYKNNKNMILKSKNINKNSINYNDKNIKKALNNKYVYTNNFMKFNAYYPIPAKNKCLKCHSNIKIGDNLGVLHIQYNQLITNQNIRRFIFYILFISSLLIFMFFILKFEIKKIIIKTIKKMTKKVEKIKNYNDLENLTFFDDYLKSSYPNELFLFFKTYQEKLKKLSFDKKLMNFQINLLDKFIINRNITKDWISYIKEVFVELNTLISLNILYSVSQIDKNKFEVLIIWKHTPSKELKEKIENEIRLNFKINQNILLIFNNQVIYNTPFIDENLILKYSIIKNKNNEKIYKNTLYLDEPCIGGFIGIGFDNTDQLLNKNEKLKYIMLENVLSVLINLIGSMKTINQYVSNINSLATRDSLTGLLNRRVLSEMAESKIKEILRRKNKLEKIFSLVFLDVDNFKLINDNYGHASGDTFLKNIANILRKNTRAEDIISRLGGDEFVIILDKFNIKQSIEIVKRIKNDLEILKKQDNKPLHKEISLSIGIVEYPKHGKNIKDLLSISDKMMYSGKKNGKNRIIACNDILINNLIKENNLKKEIVLNSIKNSLLIPYFQKIQNSNNPQEEIYELLMRINIDNKILTAKEFIDIAEKTELIKKLDLEIFDKALNILNKNNYKGKLFINVSQKSLMSDNYMNNMIKIVQKYNFKNERIIFEITERDTIKNIVYLEEIINQLIKKGFSFLLDDFESGFSSFLYLKKYNISYIKINSYFKDKTMENNIDLILLKSIIYLAHELKIKVVAKFIENKETHDLLKKLNVDYLEGYFIDIPSDKLIELKDNNEKN